MSINMLYTKFGSLIQNSFSKNCIKPPGLSLIIFLLSGCTVGPDYVRPELTVSAQYSPVSISGSATSNNQSDPDQQNLDSEGYPGGLVDFIPVTQAQYFN